MSLTLGLTGMDSATESALRSAFSDANARLSGRWQLVPESQADYVVVDMDSMYGPMSWLKLHAAGKTVIGLTSAERTQADHRLPKPTDADALFALLRELGGGAEAVAAPAPAAPAPPPPPRAPEPATPAAPAAPAARAEAPAPAAPTAVEDAGTAAPTPVLEDGPRPFAHWLRDGLGGRRRLRRGELTVLIDFDQRQYHAGTALKPLAPLFEGTVAADDFEPVSEAQWAEESARRGDAQPLTRLIWFGGLLAGHGALPDEYPADQKFRLVKWPQTEREYPKHFRIATVMMKAPATLAEVVEASGVTASEVADFINANLATGYAEAVREPEPAPEPAKPGGLFGRLRGR